MKYGKRVKITLPKTESDVTKKVSKLCFGEMFEYEHQFYIKVDSISAKNMSMCGAVNVKTHTCHALAYDTTVKIYKATISVAAYDKEDFVNCGDETPPQQMLLI